MKKTRIAASLLGAVSLASLGLVGVATPASAYDNACVSNYEWNNTYVGQTKAEVQESYGIRGVLVRELLNGDQVKKYDACGSTYKSVMIEYHWGGSYWVVASGERILA